MDFNTENCDICGKKIRNAWVDEFENVVCCSKACHNRWFSNEGKDKQYIKDFPGFAVELVNGYVWMPKEKK